MKFNKILSAMALAATMLTAGCHKSLEYSDVVFFTGTESSPVTNMYVDGPSSMGITVTSSCKMTSDVDVTLAIDPTAVDSYNAQTGASYKMLPEGSYQLSSDRVTISAGSNVSSSALFEITTMEDFEDGALYCVPLKITGTSNGMGILGASQTQYVLINQIITTKCVNLEQSWYFSVPSMMNDTSLSDMGVCTMECRVYMNSFYSASSNPGIASVIGVEENFLLRFGDISCDKNQLQYAGRGASVTSSTHFNTGQWYHIAVVDTGSELTLYINGEADQTLDSSTKSAINLAWDYMDGFHIGRSERGRYMDGCVSEARVWNRALTSVELKNNQCYVSPDSEGLVAYWRLDESEDGSTVKDLTGHGYDAVSSKGSITWFENIKCPVVD